MRELNWNFVAHIVRDVFPTQKQIVCFGSPFDLIDVLRTPEHGREAWGLYAGEGDVDSPYIHAWDYETKPSFFGLSFCNLLISFDYSPPVPDGSTTDIAIRIAQLLKDDGLIFLTNPGSWADHLPYFLRERTDLEYEIQRYSTFMTQDIQVYQR
jgi:hypothetical protein